MKMVKTTDYPEKVTLLSTLTDLKICLKEAFANKYDLLDDNYANFMMKELPKNHSYILVGRDYVGNINHPRIVSIENRKILE